VFRLLVRVFSTVCLRVLRFQTLETSVQDFRKRL